MRKLCIVIFIISVAISVFGQDIVVKRGDENLQAIKVDDKIWLLRMDGEEYFILQRSTVDSLTKKIQIQQATITRHEKVLAINDTLLNKFSNFEQSANTQISTQKKLVATADSLFKGYKSLYSDLKRAVGLSTYSLVPGVGLVHTPANKWRPVGSIGVGYYNWLAQYQFGKDYYGVLVGFRWSFGL
jgi:hypothetical protein